MIPSLDNIDLQSEIILMGLDEDRVKTEVKRSDNGVAQILLTRNDGGRKLDLYGFFTFGQEDAILALSENRMVVDLIHFRGSFRVMILGTSLKDWIAYKDPLPSDWRFGKVHLIEV